MKRALEHIRNQRWLYLGLIIAVSACLIWAIQIHGLRITHPARDVVYAIGLANLLVFLWIYVVSGFRPGMRQFAVVFWAGLQLIPLMSLRVDGFDGYGRPIMKWRWTLTAEQYFSQHPGGAIDEEKSSNTMDKMEMGKTSVGDSPGYRGLDRTGKFLLDGFVTNWTSQPPRELWRKPVGMAWSSFAVVGPLCVTQEQRGDREAVVCYAVATGREVWAHLDARRFEEVTSGIGPRATPTIHAGLVYTMGGTGMLNCMDGSTGNVKWMVDTTEAGDEPLIFGAASSPLVVDDMVVVATRGNEGWLSAFHRETGEPVWSTRTDVGSYSSPQGMDLNLSELGDSSTPHRFILNFDNANLRAFGLDGIESWRVPYGEINFQFVNVSQPVVILGGIDGGDKGLADVVVSAGYGRGTTRLRLQKDEEGWDVEKLWHSSKLGTKFSSVMVHEGYIYGLDDGILTCVRLADGKRQWKRGRYGHGQIIMVNDVLLIQAEDGDIALADPNPKQHRELARISSLHDRTWNVPVVSGRYLLVRNDREAVCYELPVN